METAKLKKFAQFTRRSLIEQVSGKLSLVLAPDSAARRESGEAIRKLEEQIKAHGKEQVIERVAYIWFNRFCALRFMDVNRYTRIGVVSPAEGQFQPEILAEAKMGHIDEDMVPEKVRQQIVALLNSKAPSRDPQGEAYRLLVVAACNFWNKAMPFLFERIADYTELLMPDDLLSGKSVLAYTREAMTPDACEDVEVIGWLYQFYISEKKDEVFDGLKKNKKITPENIPAATQLFTPHWIVRYLVENSLGRLWLLNRPGSKLVEQMDYYIKPEEECFHEKHERHEKEDKENVRDFRVVRGQEDFLRISSPEEIKICDPACGSGHMLTYAFDLLYAIYEEEGYEPAEIPEKILTHNLYGIEIDERAGELAAFALTMKARAKQRRFFTKGVKPNICVLENVHFNESELKFYMDFVGRDLFTFPLQTTLRQFEEADNFGSLIHPDVTDVDGMLRILESKDVSGQLFLSMTHQKVLQALRQADYLSPKYHVVIANPPYMGGKGMNGRLKTWAKGAYPDGKADLFAMFIEGGLSLTIPMGFAGFVTMESWMYLSSYELLRTRLIERNALTHLLHMPYLGRGGTSMGISFGTVAFIVNHKANSEKIGNLCAVRFYETDDAGVPLQFPPQNEKNTKASASDFQKIPGAPIALGVGKNTYRAFEQFQPISAFGETCSGLQTSDNNRFLRQWHEVNIKKMFISASSREDARESGAKWFPHKKGGPFRKWYGNNEFVLNWFNDGEELFDFASSLYGSATRIIKNTDKYFKPGVTWSHTTSACFSARILEEGSIFNVEAPSLFSEQLGQFLSFLCSKVGTHLIEISNPTMHFVSSSVGNLPWAFAKNPVGSELIDANFPSIMSLSMTDWDSFETSWDFTTLPLCSPDSRANTIKTTYERLRAKWKSMTDEMQKLEQENNRICIEVYGLQDELTPEVPLNEITLTCNPHYRYGNDKSEDELEALLLADTMRELVSYAVGCMFGRYTLEKPGLILANQGETLSDYYKKLSTNDTKGTKGTKENQQETVSDFREFRGQALFPADEDNVIPMLDGDWFTDDIAERFRKFLRVAFGEDHYGENLRFVEQALNIKGKRNYTIRDYFFGEFYTDHVKRYKKRPIYWLFSSPKGSFNSLIYMHRYRPDTVSVVLNDYLREFRTKLTSHKNHLEAVSISGSASQSEKTKALKEIEKITKMIAEMEEYEREVLYPLATEQLEIDLDEGVKVNYAKFGEALKKIPGLDAKEE